MSAPSFDPGSFYELDLARGTVQTRDGQRVVVLYDSAAAALVSAAARNASREVLDQLGGALGAQAREMVGDVAGATPEKVLSEAAALLGTFGWGRLGMERWGDALVVSLSDRPAVGDDAVEAILAGFFGALAAKPVGCVAVGDHRFLLVEPGIEAEVRGWARGGAKLSAVLDRLQGA
ncbi:MAG: hypothetical protein H6721_07955 [Sandaracinus sp.]|nr:hypothetical protein [Sandaracinus sp.]MCB9632052.1 hypothetical protein [Sandaracinus sp.]